MSEGHTFNFFQAVRLLGQLSQVPVFHAHQSTAFPASPIYKIEQDPKAMGLRHITVNFIGLTGPQGVLPTHYTEALIRRTNEHDRATAAFFDIFNGRFTFLFYRAWEKYFLPAGAERGRRSDSSDGSFSDYLFDIVGLGTEASRRQLKGVDGETAAISPASLLFYSGLIAQRPHSASALAAILSDYFNVPVAVEQMRGRWLRLAETERTALGGESLSNQLGFGAVAGEEVWNCQSQFRIRAGPLTLERFLTFGPGQKGFRALSSLTRFFAGKTFEFDLQLILKGGAVPQPILSEDQPPVLGFSCWLCDGPLQTDPGDTILAAAVD